MYTRGCEVWLRSPSKTGMHLAASEVHCPQPRRIWLPSNEPCQYPWPCYSDNWTVLEGRAGVWPGQRCGHLHVAVLLKRTGTLSRAGHARPAGGRRQAASRRRSLSLASSRDFFGSHGSSCQPRPIAPYCPLSHRNVSPPTLLSAGLIDALRLPQHNTTQHNTTKPRLP